MIDKLPPRYAEKITVDSKGCWNYSGHPSSNGYQRLWYCGKRVMAHIYMFEFFNPTVRLDGLQLDHLCVNRACCNPKHLDPVTPQVNSRRKYRRRKRV